ncbi:MAG: type I-E CRISPR-associated protein Cse1/CasA [Candidatus Fimadaptatus sp.]|nr:type I-E CRISPR-associated protein Cse1/CasA [Candidatus Fimadaptatus sp.]
MKDKEFNLIDENWILVMDSDCTVHSVSLKDALLNAHKYVDFAGEMPTVNVSIMRTMLAVLQTVFERMDGTGQRVTLEDVDEAVERWGEIWRLKHFPEEPICSYLDEWHERFYLFHPERPFLQFMEAKAATEYEAKTLNGAVSESNNKRRLFSQRFGESKDRLTYSEAARWLITVNAYDSSSLKNAKDVESGGKESVGVGWLAKIGVVAARGSNLFETLMLNLVLSDESESWAANKPLWENDKPNADQRRKVAQPDNQAELLTFPSRKLLLVREGDKVKGFHRMWGDFFDNRNAFIEQMALWKYNKKEACYYPVLHDISKQSWREFPVLADNDDENTQPGVVAWLKLLTENRQLPKDYIARFMFVGVTFDGKNSSITDVYYDELSFHLDILMEVGKDWRDRIRREVFFTDKVAKEMEILGINIYNAGGGNINIRKWEQEQKSGAKSKKKTDQQRTKFGEWMKYQFYYRIDIEFRKFLESVDSMDGYEKKIERLKGWRRSEEKIAHTIAQEVIGYVSDEAIFGRTIQEKGDNDETVSKHYSVAGAYNTFTYKVGLILK